MAQTDLTKRIIYPADDGGVAIIIPCDCGLTIDEIAEKDVPSGTAFAIVDAADIPSDRSARDDWTVDESDLAAGVQV